MRIGDVKPFKYVYADDRQQFTRPLEEAAEFFVAWRFWIQRRDNQRYSAKARDKMLDPSHCQLCRICRHRRHVRTDAALRETKHEEG